MASEEPNKDLPPHNPPVSIFFTVSLIFATHGLVNSTLLSPLNPLRCSFLNLHDCNADEEWMMNWFAYGHLNVFVLLACLCRTSFGNHLLEQRTVFLTCAIITSYLSCGIFMIDFLNKPMAILQTLVYLGLLGTGAYHSATSPYTIPLPTQVRTSSFDMRRKLPVATIAVFVHFFLSAVRVVDMVFLTGRDGYVGDDSSRIYQVVSSAALNDMMITTMIFGWTIMLATPQQQQSLLMGQALVLLLSQYMLAGEQGDMIAPNQARVGGVMNFFAMLIALLGSC